MDRRVWQAAVQRATEADTAEVTQHAHKDWTGAMVSKHTQSQNTLFKLNLIHRLVYK